MNNCCDGDQDFCIPVIEETDTYFQAIVSSEIYAEIEAMMDAVVPIFHLLLLDGATNTEDEFTVVHDFTLTNELSFEKYRTGMFEITLQWRSPLAGIKEILDCGDCFQLGIARVLSSEFSGEFTDEFSEEFSVGGSSVTYDFITISNCFKRSCADCFTTVLEYYNDDDYAEFNYCHLTNPVNRVRLPFYLLQPKITEDKAVYRKSNGVVKQTKSLLTKEYQVLTEHYPEHIHDKFTVALAHDNVYVISGPYTGGISKTGEYAIEWSDNDCMAPASFKALATPYAIRNNNCQDCSEEIELCTPPVVPEFTLPEGSVGEPYSGSVTITGYQPFTLTLISTPAWFTMTLVEDLLSWSGTPDAEGLVDVIFSVSNICTDPITISKTLNIENMEAGMIVMWSGDPGSVPTGWALCDGTSGTPDLSGRFIVGYSELEVDYDEIGKTGGESFHTLDITEIPAHSHGGVPLAGADTDRGVGDASLFSLDTTGSTASAGGGLGHENRPPFYTLAFIIKL